MVLALEVYIVKKIDISCVAAFQPASNHIYIIHPYICISYVYIFTHKYPSVYTVLDKHVRLPKPAKGDVEKIREIIFLVCNGGHGAQLRHARFRRTKTNWIRDYRAINSKLSALQP